MSEADEALERAARYVARIRIEGDDDFHRGLARGVEMALERIRACGNRITVCENRDTGASE